MKKTLLVVLLSFFSVQIFAQVNPSLPPEVAFAKVDVSPLDVVLFREASPTDKKERAKPLIRVLYSRPSKKGRSIFGGLEPFGKIWRLGANESTEIQFFEPVMIDGKKVKAGVYSLFAIPNAEKWTLIINKKTNSWGAFDYDDTLDVLRVDVRVRKIETEVETLSMAFSRTTEGAKLFIAWDKTLIELPITIKK